MMRTPQAAPIVAVLLIFVTQRSSGQEAAILRGTQPLTTEQSLDEVMVAGISRFSVRALNDSPQARDAIWNRDATDSAKREQAIKDRRARFRTIIGAVDERVAADGFEIAAKVGGDGVVARLADANVTVFAVRWPVLRGVNGEGLLLVPGKPAVARVIAVPDADWAPEIYAGLTDEQVLSGHGPTPARLSALGVEVLVPTLISRDDTFSGNERVAFTNQPHREFIYRQAFELGRHIIGYEVEKIEAAVDQFALRNRQQKRDAPIGVIGVGEGGLLALYAAAVDARITATLVSGYFGPRERIWEEPIYRNIWSLLTEFGDAEIAGLIAPRPLVVEACAAPEVAGPPAVREGRRGGAAPGAIKTRDVEQVRAEFERAKARYAQLGAADHLSLIPSGDGSGVSGTEPAMQAFLLALKVDVKRRPAVGAIEFGTEQFDPVARQRRQVEELTDYTQRLMRASAGVRDEFWSKADRAGVESWKNTVEYYRNHVWEEMIGKLPEPTMPPNVRSRRVLDDAAYTGYEVEIDVYPDVIAAGILLMPKNMSATEKRPVVVCQHGLEGVPMDTISRDKGTYPYYKSFAAELAKRGFIVYAPQNPYRGEDRFRVIQRQSNPLKRSLFSYIIRQHERTLHWLRTLPNVDPGRIGFYGLSYGGKTAVRVPPILSELYALSICSADFNEWVRKNASADDSYSYVFTSEYEMPEWNLGHVANYAELASLMAPRPFMVERGHNDGVAPDEWVAAEYAKVRRHYDELQLGDRTEIEFFNGPHTINGVGAFRFLEKHLGWPAESGN